MGYGKDKKNVNAKETPNFFKIYVNTKQTRFKQNQHPFYTSSGVNSMKVFWFASVSVDMETNLLILFKAGLFRILLSKKNN